MRRLGRKGLVAAGSVAVVAVVAAAWFASRPESSAAATPKAPAAFASTLSPSASASVATPSPSPSLSPTKTVAPPPKAVPTPRSTRASTPKPKPAFRFPVPVSVGDARQVITVNASGSYAGVVAWQLRGGVWRAVIQTRSARVGTHGVVPGSTRKQGTGTTPGGTFTMTEAFGIAAKPATAMPYHQVTSDDWWVEDNNSAYYNQMRRASQGGFAVTTAGVNGSEHLISFTTQYEYVVVINFNRPPNAVRYRGAGIFLHVNGPGSTAGCVSVPLSTMVAIIDWLDPAQHPRIAIA